MISHCHRCIFVHIPKVAGQSIETFFLNSLGLQWDERAPLLLRPKTIADHKGVPENLAHLTAEQYIKFKYINFKLFKKYYKFTFVRNPYTRAISFYKYFGFDKLCKFEYFTAKELPNLFYSEKRFFVAPQHEYIFPEGSSDKSDCIVDFIGYFEKIDKDFDTVVNYLNIKNSKLPHLNSSGRKKIAIKKELIFFFKRLFIYRKIQPPTPIQKNTNLSLFYSNRSTMRNIFELYQKDFEFFNYPTKISK